MCLHLPLGEGLRWYGWMFDWLFESLGDWYFPLLFSTPLQVQGPYERMGLAVNPLNSSFAIKQLSNEIMGQIRSEEELKTGDGELARIHLLLPPPIRDALNRAKASGCDGFGHLLQQ